MHGKFVANTCIVLKESRENEVADVATCNARSTFSAAQHAVAHYF